MTSMPGNFPPPGGQQPPVGKRPPPPISPRSPRDLPQTPVARPGDRKSARLAGEVIKKEQPTALQSSLKGTPASIDPKTKESEKVNALEKTFGTTAPPVPVPRPIKQAAPPPPVPRPVKREAAPPPPVSRPIKNNSAIRTYEKTPHENEEGEDILTEQWMELPTDWGEDQVGSDLPKDEIYARAPHRPDKEGLKGPFNPATPGKLPAPLTTKEVNNIEKQDQDLAKIKAFEEKVLGALLTIKSDKEDDMTFNNNITTKLKVFMNKLKNEINYPGKKPKVAFTIAHDLHKTLKDAVEDSNRINKTQKNLHKEFQEFCKEMDFYIDKSK